MLKFTVFGKEIVYDADAVKLSALMNNPILFEAIKGRLGKISVESANWNYRSDQVTNDPYIVQVLVNYSIPVASDSGMGSYTGNSVVDFLLYADYSITDPEPVIPAMRDNKDIKFCVYSGITVKDIIDQIGGDDSVFLSNHNKRKATPKEYDWIVNLNKPILWNPSISGFVYVLCEANPAK